MAMVALDVDRIKHVGSGLECHLELALYKGRIDGRLRRWKPV